MTNEQVERYVADMVGGLPPVVHVEQACERLGIGQRELYRRVARGDLVAIRAVHTGSARLLIPRAALADYFRARLRRL